MLKIVETKDKSEEAVMPARLDELARVGARKMLKKALEREVAQYIGCFRNQVLVATA